jgi:hypothetical protein
VNGDEKCIKMSENTGILHIPLKCNQLQGTGYTKAPKNPLQLALHNLKASNMTQIKKIVVT